MTTETGFVPCPKGHLSTERDYCSECGGKLSETSAPQDRPGDLQNPTKQELCPDCGTPREQDAAPFCEVCGYNFVTGAHGEIAIMEDASQAGEAEAAERDPSVGITVPVQPHLTQWQVSVSVDPSLRSAESPEAPESAEQYTLVLSEPVLLIGRRDESRGIAPEIDLILDEAVSRRHALLTMSDTREVSLRDIGAANGTRLNGVELEPMVDYPLRNGDEITLGHWSKLRLEAVE